MNATNWEFRGKFIVSVWKEIGCYCKYMSSAGRERIKTDFLDMLLLFICECGPNREADFNVLYLI